MTPVAEIERGDRDRDRGPLFRSVARDPTTRAERRLALLAAIGSACLLGLAAVAAMRGGRASDVVLAIAAAFVPYAGLARWRLADAPARALVIATLVAACAGLALVIAPPLLSDDVWRYLWDARVLRHGIDPYAFAPDDPALAPLRDEVFERVNHAELPTIYPPIAQLVFALADLVAHAPWSAKLAALSAHLATGPLVLRLAGSRAGALAPLFVLNPLAIEEAALGGHVDAFAGLALALAALALARHAYHRAALALAGAAGIKLVGLALVPLLASPRNARRALPLVLALGASALLLLPVANAGHGRAEVSGLGHYARRWRGNDGGFAVLHVGATLALDGIGRATGAPAGWIRLPFLAPVLELARGTPLDPRAGFVEPKKAIQRPTSFETTQLGELAARALAVGLVLLVALTHARRRTLALRASRDIVLALLLVAPQAHPWYLVWLLPLEVAYGGLAGIVWSAAILVAYAPLDGWIAQRVWQEYAITRVIEYAIVGSVLLVERHARASSSDNV